jgi:exonuclease III
MTEPSIQRTGAMDKKRKIKVCTFNINSKCGEQLITAIRVLSAMETDIVILTKAKLTNGIHARYYQGYQIMATEATSEHQGRVAVIWRNKDSFDIESLKIEGNNTLSFC